MTAWDELDLNTKLLFHRANDQYDTMILTWQQLWADAMWTKDKKGVHLDNTDWMLFDKEFAKFFEYRRAVLDSEWGLSLLKRLTALRKLPEFADLKMLWAKQCKTD